MTAFELISAPALALVRNYLELMRQLKQALDPKGLLNPGKVLPKP